MNKRFLKFLIILMGVSILGVITVQLVWINNAIRVKNELLDRSINEALQQTALKLEQEQDIEVIAQMPFHRNIKIPKVPPISPPSQPIRIIKKAAPKGKFEFKFEMDTDMDAQAVAFTSQLDSIQEHHFFINCDDTDTLFTTTQAFITSRTKQLDSLERVIEKMVLTTPDLKMKMGLRTQKLKDLTTQVITEITTPNFDDLKLDDVREVVSAELKDKSIDLDFELALLKNDSIQELSSQSDSLSLAQSPYKVRLFPNAIFDQNRKLSLSFHGLNRHIYRSVSWLLLASLFFSIVILITFALSIFFILKQKKISEMKSDFINNMTHEFKTPIATISVAADSIVNEKVIGDREQVNYFVGMIKKENTRMNRQVEDILTIARLDKKDFEFHWETLDVHLLIEEAIQGIIIQAEKRGGKIETGFEATNSMITSDKIHCTNIIYNLLDNANKYSSDQPQISVLTKNVSKGVLISVIDQGIGMSKQVQANIFERFYRQSTGNIHNVKGFGLGLSYVKAVLEANQGEIRVQSEPGKGSRFDVFLPFLRE